ncbi:mycobacterial-type methylenetetrahydrofolate reductase [Prescottella subtropica]|uniref:mycobacterial-type methylenetetrahydrofolate reductase n=1 Tax=Prescottella subtropica TaxID=2545757 RepID=UPI0010F5FD3B|nr:mycobacterial-type methylenetetrahydrofolate reductase [Prescottella subtropica]
MTSLHTVALELVPPELSAGRERAVAEARSAAELCRRHGLDRQVRHVMLPGIVAEDAGRPVPVTPRMDVADFWEVVDDVFTGAVSGLCAQVTVFDDAPHLDARVRRLRDAGMDGVVFVGKPHGATASGITPVEALTRYRSLLPHRGVILMPTRRGELDRFVAKCERGATFALTQLLYSDRIVGLLRDVADRTPLRPEILLSFGFVPGIEQRIRLIDWLIHDDGNDDARREQQTVAALAGADPQRRRRLLVEHYRRVVDGVRGLGFPLSLHLEAPYGVSDAACATFAAMLEQWAPRVDDGSR